MRGQDVLTVEQKLFEGGFMLPAVPDGLFDAFTDGAVRSFQEAHLLQVDGVVGPHTWKALFASANDDHDTSAPLALGRVAQVIGTLRQPHGYRDSVRWHLDSDGVRIEGRAPEHTRGRPATVRRIWQDFGDAITEWGKHYDVPVELILATICTESRGDPLAVRREPGYRSDLLTPHRVSPGLMQTLISTAREAVGDRGIDRAWLLDPRNSIQAGTAYISRQWRHTQFDPPKVACAYNAGGVYHNRGAHNRWKMRQYPIGTGAHADRYIMWFNDCFRLFKQDGVVPEPSFFALLN